MNAERIWSLRLGSEDFTRCPLWPRGFFAEGVKYADELLPDAEGRKEMIQHAFVIYASTDLSEGVQGAP